MFFCRAELLWIPVKWYRCYWFIYHELINIRRKSYLHCKTFFYFYLFMNWKEVTSLKMFIPVISIVLLFLVCLRFPSHLLTLQVVRNRYGNEVAKLMHKFERLDFRYRKVLLDLDFLDNCIRNDVFPKFVKFRVANKDFPNPSIYRQCQIKLLKQEISNKKRWARVLKKDLLSARNDLICKLKWIDFNHVYKLFLLGHDTALRKHQKTQNKNFGILSLVNQVEIVLIIPSKYLLNFSSLQFEFGYLVK